MSKIVESKIFVRKVFYLSFESLSLMTIRLAVFENITFFRHELKSLSKANFSTEYVFKLSGIPSMMRTFFYSTVVTLAFVFFLGCPSSSP